MQLQALLMIFGSTSRGEHQGKHHLFCACACVCVCVCVCVCSLHLYSCCVTCVYKPLHCFSKKKKKGEDASYLFSTTHLCALPHAHTHAHSNATCTLHNGCADALQWKTRVEWQAASSTSRQRAATEATAARTTRQGKRMNGIYCHASIQVTSTLPLILQC